MHFLQKFADELEPGHLFELVWLPLQAMCSYARLLHHSRTAGDLELEGSGPFASHFRHFSSNTTPMDSQARPIFQPIGDLFAQADYPSQAWCSS
jgi:hypothetical protein